MLIIITTLIPVFGIMLMGMVAHRQQLLPSNTASCLNQFIYWYSLPVLLFYLMASVDLKHISLMPVLGCIIGLLMAQAIATFLLRAVKLSLQESLSGGLTACFPNVAFMGLPTILLLYPGDSEAKAMAGLVALAPTVSFVLADVMLSVNNNCAQHEKNCSATMLHIMRSLYTNPALIGATLGMVVGFGDIPIHSSIMHMAELLGSASAPCALFCMGMSVAEQLNSMRQRNIDNTNVQVVTDFGGATQARSQKVWEANVTQAMSQGIMILVKLFLTPFLVYIIGAAFGGTGVSLATMAILCAMPSAIMCHIVAVKYNALEVGCANAVLIGTLLSVGSMPLVVAVVQMLT